MTLPRQVLPGRTYLVTRRCSQRQFLLRPDDKTRQIYLYCLAVAAQRYGIHVIAWMVMSNHHHLVLHDRDGRLPEFLALLHKLTAKVLNVRWGRSENLWSSEQTCVTYLVEDADVVDKVVYSLVNPVVDHLVERAADWPGATAFHHLEGRPIAIERPRLFFRADGRMPKRVTLTPARPPGFAEVTPADWAARIRELVAAKERAAREERQAKRLRVRGRKAVLRASAFDKPETRERLRHLRPAVACHRREARVRELCALRAFRAAHAAARQRLLAGHRDVHFPPGSYRYRALVEPAAHRPPLPPERASPTPS